MLQCDLATSGFVSCMKQQINRPGLHALLLWFVLCGSGVYTMLLRLHSCLDCLARTCQGPLPLLLSLHRMHFVCMQLL